MDCSKYSCSFLRLFLKWQNPSDAPVMMTLIDYHSFYHHYQFAPFDSLCPRAGKPLGDVQFTPFKTLHVPHQTTWLHMQELDPVSPRVDKHIDTTVKRIFPHLRTDKSAEGVKALAHIGRLRPEPVSETVVQAKHCPGWCGAYPR